MLISIHPKNPQERLVKQVVSILRKGGVIIYPTDTIYGLGCDIFQPKSVERICRIKDLQLGKAKLSFVCSDLSHLSKYAKQLDTPVYRILRQHLPGPYTFILNDSKDVPKILKTKKDTIGLRVPDNSIALSIVRELGNPILSASLPEEDVNEYTDPEVIYEKYQNMVDVVVDGGNGGVIPSTVVDLTGAEAEVLRYGAGLWP